MTDHDTEPIVDFSRMGRRIADALIRVAGVALTGAVIDGAIRGLTFALLGRWVGVFVILAIGSIAVMTALHALGGAGRAGQRGERLSSADVGLAPRRIAERGLMGALSEASAARRERSAGEARDIDASPHEADGADDATS